MACVYILRCGDGKFYVGSTEDLQDRMRRHNGGYGSDFTRLHNPVHGEQGRTIELVYTEEYSTYKEAFKRERQLHGWSHAKKEALINGDIQKLKELCKKH